MSRRIEFTVERANFTSDHVFVDGRVCQLPIKVGDIFTKVYGHKQRWDGKAWIVIDSGSPEHVRLEIQSIESYCHFFDELDSAMTARLKLTGDGLEKLVAGKILGTEDTIP